MDIKEFLKKQYVAFDVLPHSRTETAIGTANALDVPQENFAKTVVLMVDGLPAIAVVLSPYQVNPVALKKALGAGVVELATEQDLKEYFSDCETGAVAPFGSHYGMATVVDEHLTKDEYIVFDGNTHEEAISIRFKDYQMLEKPHEADIRDTHFV